MDNTYAPTENKEQEKIKVESIDIVVTGPKEKPYYSIKYRKVGSNDDCIGYGSYTLEYVLEWKEQCFELVERESDWIPVSERLPKKPEIDGDSDCYIVQTRHVAQPFIGYWDGREWTDEEVDILDEVIAWMPLPEPYKEKNRMTNREYMINLLLDGLESRLNRVSIDDGGASEEAMIYYNINCPYYAGDKRAYCRKEGSLVSSREVCVDCKAHWLEQEVDE